jgi:mevalonate pyrophosphate decarboxylase
MITKRKKEQMKTALERLRAAYASLEPCKVAFREVDKIHTTTANGMAELAEGIALLDEALAK